MSHTRFIAIGECMLEFSQRQADSFALDFAGDSYNVALYVARLLPAEACSVGYYTALGDDPYSSLMLQAWQNEGIDCQYVARIPGALPGLYLIRTDADGEREFFYYRQHAAAKCMFDPVIVAPCQDALIAADYLYLSGISLAILHTDGREQLWEILAKAKQRGAKICFDGNYRARLWPSQSIAQEVINKTLPLVDICLPTFSDEKELYGDASIADTLVRLTGHGIKEIVVKDGGKGCHLYHEGEIDAEVIAAEKVDKVVDTTAAGDSFNAAYLAARLQNKDMCEAAKQGHRLAAQVITHPGAIISAAAMPDL